MTNRETKPFIKWAGGKGQLLEQLERLLPHEFDEKTTYVEPFVGGGAVVFSLLRKHHNIRKAVINDVNQKLITVYKVIKDKPLELINALRQIQNTYLPKNAEGRKVYYLEQRSLFNSDECDDVQLASIFIFLNRTCFNGLYRENSKGKFNVPHGRYANPKICDEETIMADSELLQRVEIHCGDYSSLLPYADKETFFYFDPPYRPLTETSSFTSYVKGDFDDNEQKRLKEFCDTVTACGCAFLLSNSDPKDGFFDKLYSSYNIHRVKANRMINSKGDGRGQITELMIANYKD